VFSNYRDELELIVVAAITALDLMVVNTLFSGTLLEFLLKVSVLDLALVTTDKTGNVIWESVAALLGDLAASVLVVVLDGASCLLMSIAVMSITIVINVHNLLVVSIDE